MTGELGIKKFCVVCSEEEERDRFCEDGSSLLDHRQFSRFCGELEMCTDCGVEEEEGKRVFKAFSFLEGLEEQKEKVFVCEECLRLVEEAMERKEELEGKEGIVLKLQVELLERLKELEECTREYYEEMEGILERVRGAEVDHERMQVGGNNLRWKRCDVLLFRERIFDVVTYLGMFQETVKEKLVQMPPIQPGLAEEEENFEDASVSLPPSPMEIDYFEESVKATCGDPIVKLGNQNKSDHEIEANELPIKRRSLRKKKVIKRSSFEEDAEEDQDPTFQDPAAVSDEVMKPPKKASGRNKIISKTPCKCPQCDQPFSNKYHLDAHIKRIHKKEFTIFCEVCGKGDTNRCAITFHKTRLHGMCSVKGCTFSLPGDRLGLRNHQVEAHGKEIDVLTCPECGKLYIGFSDLRRHLRELHGKTEILKVQKIGNSQRQAPLEDKQGKVEGPPIKVENPGDNEEIEKSIQPIKQRSQRNRKAIKSGSMEDDAEDFNEDADYLNSEGSEPSEEDTPRSSKKKVVKKRRKNVKGRQINPILTKSQSKMLETALAKVNLSEMSHLKGSLVKGIIKRNTLFPTPDLVPCHSQQDVAPSLERFTPLDKWTYDPSTDQITLDGFKISVLEDPNKPTNLDLQCSDCGHKSSFFAKVGPINKRSSTNIMYRLQESMFNHVLGPKHLNRFQCPLCSFQGTSLRTWHGHKAIHDDPDSGTCSICGLKLNSLDALRKHVVLHDKPGLPKKPWTWKPRKPRPSDKRPAGNRFQCSTCGKLCCSTGHLRNHEESHKSAEEKEYVVCPLCGVRVTRASYAFHKKRYHTSKHLCPDCGKTFWNMKSVKYHMKNKHGEGTKSQCDLCGGSFKHLRVHKLNVHGDRERKKYHCARGCGRWYKVEVSQRKHEAQCQGP